MMSHLFLIQEDDLKGVAHIIAVKIQDDWIPALQILVSKVMDLTILDPLGSAKILLSFHYAWYKWHVQTARLPIPTAGVPISIVTAPTFSSILTNIQTGSFIAPPIPLR